MKEINSSDSPFQDLGYSFGTMYLPPEVDDERKGFIIKQAVSCGEE